MNLLFASAVVVQAVGTCLPTWDYLEAIDNAGYNELWAAGDAGAGRALGVFVANHGEWFVLVETHEETSCTLRSGRDWFEVYQEPVE